MWSNYIRPNSPTGMFSIITSLFSRSFSSEKCPTITVASFFFFFFRQTKELTLYSPLFSTDFHHFTGNPTVMGSSPCFSQKLFRAFAKASPLQFFSGTKRLFSNCFCLQRVPPSFFLIFCNRMNVEKSERARRYGLVF